MCVCLSVCVWIQNPGRYRYLSKPGHGRGRIVIFYYIYIHIYIYIDWYVTQKSKSGEFVGTFLLLLLLLLLATTVVIIFVCVFYPCKQFVVVTIRRTGSWNTIPTLPYSPLSDSGKNYRDSLSIHRLVSRKNDSSGRQKKSPSEQISSLSENSLESITIQSNPHSASTVAALLNDIFTLVVVVVVIIGKAEAKPSRIYRSSRRKFTSYDQNFTPIPRKKGRRQTKKKQQQHQNHDPPPHGFHPIIINNLLLLLHYYQTFRNHHQKILSKSLSRRNGNHSL